MASEIGDDDIFGLTCLLRWAFAGRASTAALDMFDFFLGERLDKSSHSGTSSPFRTLNLMPSLDEATLKRCYLHAIDRLVHSDAGTTAQDALGEHETWLEEFESSKIGLVVHVVELLVPFSKSEIEDVLGRAMHKKPLSWKNFLLILWVALRYADISSPVMEGIYNYTFSLSGPCFLDVRNTLTMLTF